MSDDDDGGRGRGPMVVLALVGLLGVVTLYVALGGPLPFLAEGGPALDSVPAEADAVVYSDAWTFSSDTSRSVADGLLTATNESVPGYAGPASLDAAVETLQDTDLQPAGLRSITAFTAYGSQGQPTQYGGLVLKTRWGTPELLSAFGGDREEYTERERLDTTVYVHDDENVQFPWVAELGPDRVVLGNESAVLDSINATEGRERIDPTLESGFRSLRRGPIRFASTVPDSFPGEALTPEDVTETVAQIETGGGTYYPDGSEAGVDIEVSAADEATAQRIEPALNDAVEFTRRRAPETTAKLLADAAVTRDGGRLRLSMSGTTEAFVDGYRAFLQADVVRLLLGQAVGTPALDLVPQEATTVAYADAGVVADPTTFGVANEVVNLEAAGAGGDLRERVAQVRRLSALDLTAFRSVTAYAAPNATDGTDSALIVEANWSRAALARTFENAAVPYDTTTVAGRPVFVFETDRGPRHLAVLEGHQALGAPAAVERVLETADGDRPALDGRLREAFERLPGRYVAGVTELSPSVDEGGGSSGALSVLGDVNVLGVSYHSRLTGVDIQVDLHMASQRRATEARITLELARRLAAGNIDDERLSYLLEATRISRTGQVVSGHVRTDREAVVAFAGWLLDQPFTRATLAALDNGLIDTGGFVPVPEEGTS
jgi:hypothetical protein